MQGWFKLIIFLFLLIGLNGFSLAGKGSCKGNSKKKNCPAPISEPITSEVTSQNQITTVNSPVEVSDQCKVYLDGIYAFEKSISVENCNSYCERVRPDQICLTKSVVNGSIVVTEEQLLEPAPSSPDNEINLVSNSTTSTVVCSIYIDGTYRFDKDISAGNCDTYCERVRPDQNCNAKNNSEAPSSSSSEASLTDRVPSSFNSNIDLPMDMKWTIMYSHPTLGITQSWLDKNYDSRVEGVYSRRRGSLTSSAPGGGQAFKHTVTTKDIVEPFRFHGPVIKRNNSLDNGYLLRFKHYVTAHSGAPGKLIQLEGGRGYAGDGYRSDNINERGTGGWGINLMHPVKQDQNYYRLFGSHNTQSSLFGSNFSGSTQLWPIKQWVTIDMIVTVKGADNSKNKGGYKLYVDGKLYLQKTDINIFLDNQGPINSETINFYVRLMHGGHPDANMSLRDYTEYFKDLELYRGVF